MALRYSGSLTVRVVWNDRGYYNASVSRKGRNLWSGTVGAPRSSRVAVDSPEAYDATASAALSFAAHDGADVDDAGAEVTRKPQTSMRRANPARKRPAAKRARKAPKRRTAKR